MRIGSWERAFYLAENACLVHRRKTFVYGWQGEMSGKWYYAWKFGDGLPEHDPSGRALARYRGN